MLYINLDWDWLMSNSCKCSCRFYKIHKTSIAVVTC